MNILAISGSSASSSINTRLLNYLAENAASASTIEVVSVRDFPAPIYSTDLEKEGGIPDSMKTLYARIQAADGLILGSPEHNGMPPAMFKNAIDWISREGGQKFLAKPVALVSTSPGGRGGASVLGILETLIPHWGADVVGKVGVGRFYDVFDAEAGAIRDAEIRAALHGVVAALEARIATN